MSKKQLRNDFSWSASRDSAFKNCKRAYYYNYYGSWGGWDKGGSDEFTRILYIMKNIKSLPIWAGTLVHDLIAKNLRDYVTHKNNIVINSEILKSQARGIMRSSWLEAVGYEWVNKPKSLNLDPLYYGNGKSLPKEMTDNLANKVYSCLHAFAESPVFRRIVSIPYVQWKPVDELDSFVLDNVKIWCALDFAFNNNGKLHIIDWKTGAEKTDALGLQLATYAYYANQKWGYTPEEIRVFGCFLGEDARLSEYSLDGEMLVESRQKMLSSISDMQSYLKDVENNIPFDEEFFPCTDKEWVCKNCSFRGACSKFVPRNEVSLPNFLWDDPRFRPL